MDGSAILYGSPAAAVGIALRCLYRQSSGYDADHSLLSIASAKVFYLSLLDVRLS